MTDNTATPEPKKNRLKAAVLAPIKDNGPKTLWKVGFVVAGSVAAGLINKKLNGVLDINPPIFVLVKK